MLGKEDAIWQAQEFGAKSPRRAAKMPDEGIDMLGRAVDVDCRTAICHRGQ